MDGGSKRVENVYLRIKQVIERTGLSRSTIYNKMNPKHSQYDSSFPLSIKLGLRATAWAESDLNTWLSSCTGASGIGNPQPIVDTAEEHVVVKRSRANTEAKPEAIDAMRFATVRRILEENATMGALVRCKELMASTMLSTDSEADWKVLDKILDDVMRASHAEKGVLLGAHVRELKGVNGVPRDAFFAKAQSLGYKFEDRNTFALEQLLELFGAYCDPKYKTAKKVQWIVVRGDKCHLLCQD